MCRRTLTWLFLLAFLTLPTVAFAVAPELNPAPSAPATQAQIAALQDAIKANTAATAAAQTAGDNGWMLVSSALVLLMTGPGLALFYGGLVRKKNILGTMMQSFAMMGIVTVLWAVRWLLPRLRSRQLVCRWLRAPLPQRRRPHSQHRLRTTIPSRPS